MSELLHSESTTDTDGIDEVTADFGDEDRIDWGAVALGVALLLAVFGSVALGYWLDAQF